MAKAKAARRPTTDRQRGRYRGGAPEPPSQGAARDEDGHRQAEAPRPTGGSRRGAPKPTSGVIGREPKLTDAKIEAVAAKVADGVPLVMACELNGVSGRAGTYWLAMARHLIERVPRKRKDEVTGEEPEAVSPWPRLPSPLLVRFLRAVEHARAIDEANRIARITESATGGAVLYERTEERTNEKTGARSMVTEKRFAAPDWHADAWLLERRAPDRWGRRIRFENSAPPADPSRMVPDFLEIVTQAWVLIRTAKDPRRLPPATIEAGTAAAE